MSRLEGGFVWTEVTWAPGGSICTVNTFNRKVFNFLQVSQLLLHLTGRCKCHMSLPRTLCWDIKYLLKLLKSQHLSCDSNQMKCFISSPVAELAAIFTLEQWAVCRLNCLISKTLAVPLKKSDRFLFQTSVLVLQPAWSERFIMCYVLGIQKLYSRARIQHIAQVGHFIKALPSFGWIFMVDASVDYRPIWGKEERNNSRKRA